MSASDGSSSGDDTEEFSIEDLERMASGEEDTSSAKKKKTLAKRKAPAPPEVNSDDEDSDHEDPKPKPKKVCFDGTAKPQGDDIVRSKTIAKVISVTKSHTYDDGSYLVPCVLMAC